MPCCMRAVCILLDSNLMISAIAHFEDPAHSANLTSTELLVSRASSMPSLKNLVWWEVHLCV